MNKKLAITIDIASIISLLIACYVVLNFKSVEFGMFMITTVFIIMLVLRKNVMHAKFTYDVLALVLFCFLLASIAFIIYCEKLGLYTYSSVFFISIMSLTFISNLVVDIKKNEVNISLESLALQIVSIILLFVAVYSFYIANNKIVIGRIENSLEVFGYCFSGIYLLLATKKMLNIKSVKS